MAAQGKIPGDKVACLKSTAVIHQKNILRIIKWGPNLHQARMEKLQVSETSAVGLLFFQLLWKTIKLKNYDILALKF